MPQMRHSPVCILGGGPAALLSQALLRHKGVAADVVADTLTGSLTPMQVGGVRVSPVPVFVSPESALFRKLAWGPLTDADRVTTGYSPTMPGPATDEALPGSYAEFMTQRYPDAQQRLIITKKHVGPVVFQRDLPGLRRKVLAHYPAGRAAARRVGFCDGVSPYLHYLERNPGPDALLESVRAIDIARRRVTTSTHRVITYERLICTLPLMHFLALANIATSLTALSGGAQLVVASCRQAAPRNHLLYDCDVASAVHRVFIPREGFVIAQVARGHWDADTAMITTRIQQLFDFGDPPIVLKRLTIPACYPLALSDYAQRDALVDTLQGSGVTLFGRFAQWEYLDLEELNWERIECLS